MRQLDAITDLMDVSLNELRETVKHRGNLACYSPWGHKELDITEQQRESHLYLL